MTSMRAHILQDEYYEDTYSSMYIGRDDDEIIEAQLGGWEGERRGGAGR